MRKKKKKRRKARKGAVVQYSFLRDEINRLKEKLRRCTDPNESRRIRDLLDILEGDDYYDKKEKYSKRKRYKKF